MELDCESPRNSQQHQDADRSAPSRDHQVEMVKSAPANQTTRSEDVPVLVVSTLPVSHTTKIETLKTERRIQKRGADDLYDVENIQICIYATCICVGAFFFLTGLVICCVGYSVSPYSHVEIIVRGHRAGGPMLMGFGAALIAFGMICCFYSRRPPLPRRPPQPNPQRTGNPRTSITGMGSTTIKKGPQLPFDKPRTSSRRKGSITLPEPQETTGLPEAHVNVAVDLDDSFLHDDTDRK